MMLFMLYKVVLPFETVDKVLTCDHSNEKYAAVLFCGIVPLSVQLYKLVITFNYV